MVWTAPRLGPLRTAGPELGPGGAAVTGKPVPALTELMVQGAAAVAEDTLGLAPFKTSGLAVSLPGAPTHLQEAGRPGSIDSEACSPAPCSHP